LSAMSVKADSGCKVSDGDDDLALSGFDWATANGAINTAPRTAIQ